LDLDCTPFGNKTKRGVEEFVDTACKVIKALDPAPEAIIDLRLKGSLNLNRIALDPTLAAIEIAEKTEVFAVAIDPSQLNLGIVNVGGKEDLGDGISREELERSALGTLLEDENLWGLDEQRQHFAELFYDLKEGVLHEQTADQLAEQIAISPLVERVVQAKVAPPAVDTKETRVAE